MNETPKNPEVLIVGAGPTGLVLALWLTHLGVRLRIIDKTAGPGTTSRALAVQARILEQYDQLGLADAIVARGLKMSTANLWIAGKTVSQIRFGDDMGTGLTRFPYALIFPQDEHEKFLIEQLRKVDIEVERNTALTEFIDNGSQVRAVLRQPDGSEENCEVAYVAGCDGAHSRVREILDMGFPGGTYAHLFYVADVEASGPMMDHKLHVAIDEADFVAVFPLRAPGRARLIGTAQRQDGDAKDLTWEDVSKSILERTRISVERVNWFSTYRVHHRVARHFGHGRAFLLGDAAHIHSPVGGQGMNTGIGDAINLAWKLAALLFGAAHQSVLKSYEQERRHFALQLVATTDRVFTFVTRDGALARFVRLHIAPRIIPLAFMLPLSRRFLFRRVSQIAVDYRNCDLNQGRAGDVAGGDRLPWIAFAEESGKHRDNYETLNALDWQAHVYGQPSRELVQFCAERKLALHIFAWRPDMKDAGLRKNAIYLIRPDGYIAMAHARGEAARLRSYLDKWHIQPLARSRARRANLN